MRLDLERMSINVAEGIAGSITTTDALELRLAGDWTKRPQVSIDDQTAKIYFKDDVLTVTVPVGSHNVTISPKAQGPRSDND